MMHGQKIIKSISSAKETAA